MNVLLPRCALVLLASCGLATTAALAGGQTQFAAHGTNAVAAAAVPTDRLIVKYRRGDGPYPTAQAEASVRVASNRQGVKMSPFRRTASGAHVFQLSRRLSHDELQAMASSLRAGDPNIDYVEPDRLLQPMFVPNDALYAQQWHLSDATAGIRAPAAWDRTRGAGVTVAVIDTGVRPHEDLAANLLAGFDFITDAKIGADGNGRDADASDPGDYAAAGACGTGSPATKSSWHGTHVAGIVAAVADNAKGVVGVAHGAKVLPLRVLGRCGGYTSDIADAMVWAAGGSINGVPANPAPAKVLNLSLGGTGACDVTTQNAINAVRAKGAVVVVAAGNDNVNAANASPANCAGVITVAATGRAGGKASYSNFGANVTLAAPGGDNGGGILSTLNAGTAAPAADSYANYMGTSMATPVVSGVAALMFAVNPKLTPDQVTALLKSSARAFPAACGQCGAGLVDASAAVAAAVAATATPTPTPAPAPAPAPTPAPAPAPSGPAAVKEVEPNNTLAAAQAIASLRSIVSGSIAKDDNDYFKVVVPAGKKLTATLAGGVTTSLGLNVYNTAGGTLLTMPAATARTQQALITNSGSAPVTLVFRVVYASGPAGAYTLGFAD